MASPGEENHNRILLCQLFESSTLLAQLGALVSEGLDRLMITQEERVIHGKTQK
uniref:Uncharacterized protein n=1 Tax=Parascaris equorum TaxID=6256 RepID=A0A914S5K1_PAREQ